MEAIQNFDHAKQALQYMNDKQDKMIKIYESYSIISKLDIKTLDYLTFVAEMGKTLMDLR